MHVKIKGTNTYKIIQYLEKKKKQLKLLRIFFGKIFPYFNQNALYLYEICFEQSPI